MRIVRALIALALSCILLLACEREYRELGGVEKPLFTELNLPVDSAKPQVYSVARASHVLELANREQLVIAPDGAALYAANCMACHQATGLGVPGAFPPLDGTKYVISDNTERLAAIMIYGLQGPINVNGTVFTSVMPGQGALLNDEELSAIASYIRSNWSNKAEPVPAEVFSKVRARFGSRGPFAIAELGEEH